MTDDDTSVLLEDPAAVTPAAAPTDLVHAMARAAAFERAGRHDLAQAQYDACAADGQAAGVRIPALFNRALLRSHGGDTEGAARDYALVLALDAGFAPARLNLGHLHERRGEFDAALAQWRTVAEAPDGKVERAHRLHAWNNLGRLLEQQRRFPDAEAALAASLAIDPAQPAAIQHWVHLRQKQCRWPAWGELPGVGPHALLNGTSLLAMMSCSDDPALQMLAADRFARERVAPAPEVPYHRLRATPRDGKLKIAYLSGDLHMHAVGLLTAELYGLHDRSRFEVWGFCWTPESAHPLRRRLRAGFDHLVPIGAMDDDAAARLIVAAGIDIVVDLQGLTQGARPGILVRRPAPVQVGYLGLPGTACLDGVDHVLADDFVIPPAERMFYREQPIALPHCFQVSDRQREVLDETPPRARYGLPDDAFVFCSFNNNFKFTPETTRAWWRILDAVPGSVLWLLADNAWSRANLEADARAHGVDPARLHFAPRVTPAEYLARFRCADLMLDTFPYNAGTTANDALWMGLPLVTLAGRSYISRQAGSLLNAVGLPDLVTTSLADYERLAILLGRTPARVASMARYLREHGRKSRLFDVPATVRAIEDALEPLAQRARAAQHAAAR